MQRHGERHIDPEAERWHAAVSAAVTRLRAVAPSGVLVEPKGLSVTCHYRANPFLEPQVMALAQEVAAATGLVVRRGRKSVELLPPIHADKGTVIRNWAAPLRSVCYLSDDLGDLAAFRALDQLATRGISTARIAVRSDEAPAELLQAADVIIDAPEGSPSPRRLEAVAAGEYSMSTRGVTLGEQGFIHCSLRHQLPGVAEFVYSDTEELIVLVIDKVPAPVRHRAPGPGAEEYPRRSRAACHVWVIIGC